MSSTIQVMFIDNDGGGYASNIDVAQGTTIREFFSLRKQGRDPSAFLIRVNRAAVPSTYILQQGDTVAITPTKIDGA